MAAPLAEPLVRVHFNTEKRRKTEERCIRVCLSWKRFLVRMPQVATGMAGEDYGQALRGEAHRDGRVKSLKKSIVVLNRRTSWRNCGVMDDLDTKHCGTLVEALNWHQEKTVGSLAVKRTTRWKCNEKNVYGNPFTKMRHSEDRQMNKWMKRKLECTEAPWQG